MRRSFFSLEIKLSFIYTPPRAMHICMLLVMVMSPRETTSEIILRFNFK